MEKIDVDAALALLKLGKNIPNLFAHENGAWWINQENKNTKNEKSLPKHTVSESNINIDEWEIL